MVNFRVGDLVTPVNEDHLKYYGAGPFRVTKVEEEAGRVKIWAKGLYWTPELLNRVTPAANEWGECTP